MINAIHLAVCSLPIKQYQLQNYAYAELDVDKDGNPLNALESRLFIKGEGQDAQLD